MKQKPEIVQDQSEDELQPVWGLDDSQPGAFRKGKSPKIQRHDFQRDTDRENKHPQLGPHDFQPGAPEVSKRQKKQMLKKENAQQTQPIPEKTKKESKESKSVLATEEEYEKGKIAFKLGVELYSKNQNDEALEQMTLSLNNHYPPAFLFLRDVFQQEMKDVNKHKKALKEWCAQESKKSQTQDANTFYCLGLYSDLVADNKKLAVEWYKKAIALNPKHLEALYRLGKCYENGASNLTKSHSEALKYYAEAAKQDYKLAKIAIDKLRDDLDKQAQDKILEAKKKVEKLEKEKAKREEKEKAKSESLKQVKVISAGVLPDQLSASPMNVEASIRSESVNRAEVKKVEVVKQADELVKTTVATSNKKPENKAKNPLSALFKGADRSASSEVSIPVVESKKLKDRSLNDDAFEKGQKAYRIGRYEEALPYIFESGTKGHALARLYCGVMFKRMGNHQVADALLQTLVTEEKQFIEILKKLRNPELKCAYDYWFCLGLYCEFVSKETSNPLLRPSKALEYYEEGVARNEIQATYHLAMLKKFEMGRFFPLLEKAASLGHEQAQVFMQMYDTRFLAPLDAKASLPEEPLLDKVTKVFEKRAIWEDTILFLSFEIIGAHVQALLNEAKEKLTLAAEEGHVRAQFLLAVLYYQLAKNMLLSNKEATNERYALAMKYATQALKGNYPVALDLIKCIKRDQPGNSASGPLTAVQASVGRYSPGVFSGSVGASSSTTTASSTTTSSSLRASGESFTAPTPDM